MELKLHRCLTVYPQSALRSSSQRLRYAPPMDKPAVWRKWKWWSGVVLFYRMAVPVGSEITFAVAVILDSEMAETDGAEAPSRLDGLPTVGAALQLAVASLRAAYG